MFLKINMKMLTPEEIQSQFTEIETDQIRHWINSTIKSISSNNSVFTLSQIKNQVNRKYVQTNERWKKKDNVQDMIQIMVEKEARGGYIQSLTNSEKEEDILRGGFTTKENLEAETKCFTTAKHRSEDYVVSEDIVNKWLATMPTISEEQKDAVLHVCYGNPMVSIYQGKAGAGKSFTAKAIKESFKDRGFDVKGLALSWNAANVLSGSAGIDDVEAIEAFSRRYLSASKTRDVIFKRDTLLLVDEAGLIGTKHMSHILSAAYEAHQNNIIVKVVLTGDALQLLPVNAGGMFKTLEEQIGSAVIKQIRRQEQESQRKMVELSSQRRSGQAIYTMLQQENIHFAHDHEATKTLLVQNYLSYKLAPPKRSAIVLTSTNNQAVEINEMIREYNRKLGKIEGLEIDMTVSNGDEASPKKWRAKFAKGDQVVLRANYKQMPCYAIPKDENDFDLENKEPIRVGAFNRTVGEIKKVMPSPNGGYDVYIDAEIAEKKVRLKLNTNEHLQSGALPLNHAYATTIYGSQGQTHNQSFMYFSVNPSEHSNMSMNFRLFYVGISRHKQDIALYINENELIRRLLLDRGRRDLVKTVQDGEEQIFSNDVRKLFSRMDMLKLMAKEAGKDQQNETAYDYVKKTNTLTVEQSRRKNETELERELYDIKPASLSDNLQDYDSNYLFVEAEDVLSQTNRNKWWQNLYIHEKTVGSYVVEPEKVAKIEQNALEMNEEFQKYKKQVLQYNGLPEDYQIEEGDRIHYREKVSVRYPLIDLGALMDDESLTKITETAFIPEEEVKHNAFKQGESVYRPIFTQEEEENEIKKAMNELRKENGGSSLIDDILEEIKRETKQEDFEPEYRKERVITGTSKSMFRGMFGLSENFKFENEEEDKQNNELEDYIVNEPKEIKFIPEKDNTMQINLKAKLEFISENHLGGQEFVDFLNYNVKGYIWEEGKYHEPRFLARDVNGVIRERYDEFGKAKLGTGYPAILDNQFKDVKNLSKTPVYLVPTAETWLYSWYYYTKRAIQGLNEEYLSMPDYLNSLSPEKREELIKIPELIWGTDTMDYFLLKDYLKGRSITILQGKDGTNEEWAYQMREKLWNACYQKVNIVPPLSDPEKQIPPWEKVQDEQIKNIAEGNYDNGDLSRAITNVEQNRGKLKVKYNNQ